MVVQQVDEVHQDSSVMYRDTLAELECSLYITLLSVCCKWVYIFLIGGPFSRARKKFPYFLHG